MKSTAIAVRMRRFLPLLLLPPLLWALHVHRTARVAPFDDAFITYRYVENVVAGRGLVYNAGEHVLGSTTPLYLLLLAALKAVFRGVALPVLAVAFNFLPFAAAGVAAWLLLEKITGCRPVALLAAAFLLTDPPLLALSLGGMESYLFVSLALFSLLAAASRRPVWLGALAALACLTRPEGALLLPIGAAFFVRSPRALLRGASAFLLTIAPWAVFALFYYGSIIPLSVIAKSKPLYPVPPGFALERLSGSVASWIGGAALGRGGGAASWIAMTVPFLVTAAALFAPEFRRRKAFLPALFFAALVLFYAAGNPMMFPWYLPAIFTTWALTIFAALPLTAPGRSRAGGSGRWASIPHTMLVATIIAAGIARCVKNPSPQTLLLDKPGHMRIREYRKAAEYLNEHFSPGETAAAPEIGSFGYYFKGKILDACGLVSPEAHPFLPVPEEERLRPGLGAISTEFVRETNPDYIVTMMLFAVKSLDRSSWFRENYERIERIPFPSPVWGSAGVVIYGKKKDPP